MNHQLHSKEVIHIIFATDDAYVVPLGVALTSILEHATHHQDLRFYVMDGGLNEENKNRLHKLTNGNIEFISIDQEQFRTLPITESLKYASQSTYYRYVIPDLKPELSKILYLDCDIVVKKSLDDLWRTNIDNHYAAACEDTLSFNTFQWKNDLGLKSTSFYFNAGVMLMNLEKMRADNLSQKLFECTHSITSKTRWGDQDALNIVMEDHVVLLPPQWNVLDSAFVNPGTIRYTPDEIESAKIDPAIIHFAGPFKPWRPGGVHFLRHEYYLYFRKLSWTSDPLPKELYDDIIVAQKKYQEEAKRGYEAIVDKCLVRNNELTSLYNQVIQSRSWQITAPLRKIMSFFRRN